MSFSDNRPIFSYVCPSQVSCKLSPDLSDLVVYCRSVPFRGFENVSEKIPNEMSSFSENEALKLIKDSGTTVEITVFLTRRRERESKIFCDIAADSTENIISLQCIMACGFLSFHLQESCLWDTTAGSWAGSTPPASASNHPTMILRKCGMVAARWVSTPG